VIEFFLSLVALQRQAVIDAPYVSSPEEVVSAMLRLADVKPTDIVYDLGSGDGRIVIAAAHDFGARGVGVELNADHIRDAKQAAQKAGVADRTRFLQQDLFDADIREATVVTLYLLPDINLKLKPKLLRELKPGTRIVSHSFHMGDWKPDKEITVSGNKIYLWVVRPKTE
jgi:SAM-dependent methyltransferase